MQPSQVSAVRLSGKKSTDMTVTTNKLQSDPPTEEESWTTPRLPSGRFGYINEYLIPDGADLSCVFCGWAPKTADEPRIIYVAYGGRTEHLCLCPHCADQLMASLIQDLARVIEVEGFVAGGYMAQRQEQIVKDFECIMFAGKMRLPPGRQ
jgi:hypothetical protein